MIQHNAASTSTAVPAPRTGRSGTGLKFIGRNDFQAELRRRVAEYFERTGRRERDCAQWYVKAAAILAVFAASYVALVFFAQTWWQGALIALVLALATAAVGLNIQHDGAHGAASSRAWINRLMACSLDLIGGSSYLWHLKHNVLHHTYVNVTGHDTDVDLGALGRLTPHQKRYPFHRWQHYYIWPLYGLMAVRWHLIGDFLDIARGRLGGRTIPRPRGWDLVVFIAGKAVFLMLAFGVPMLLHPWWVVLLFYLGVGLVLGIVLSVVFQLAHAVEEAEFPIPQGTEDAARIDNAWAIHQVESTVDFARRSRLATYLLGGLNLQVEHHLLPRISHVHYRAIAPVVEQTCRDLGVRYNEHPTIAAGIASHFRWLREMGGAEAPGK
jgi:linoleoyl-CoA desaturase